MFKLNNLFKKIFFLNNLTNVIKNESNLFFISLLLLGIIIIPTFILIIYLLKYKDKDENKLKLNWINSKKIELIIWGVPFIIVTILSILLWKRTHELEEENTYIYHNKKTSNKYITIGVVALDWRWLFMYFDLNIASINECVVPINTPIIFKTISLHKMNSFYIPGVSNQIYCMPKMYSTTNIITNKIGSSYGISSNYSGDGFSHMKFKFRSLNLKNYKSWEEYINYVSKDANDNVYKELRKQIISNKIIYYKNFDIEYLLKSKFYER